MKWARSASSSVTGLIAIAMTRQIIARRADEGHGGRPFGLAGHGVSFLLPLRVAGDLRLASSCGASLRARLDSLARGRPIRSAATHHPGPGYAEHSPLPAVLQPCVVSESRALQSAGEQPHADVGRTRWGWSAA